MKLQEFYWNSDDSEFYYVNFQEETYLKITKEDKVLYKFLSNIFCTRWEYRPDDVNNFKLVSNIKDIYR